ncbi:hypothetical protein EJ03DRAFT_195084 [Teratosphaeria nubilosa]|uniref:Uncharacterized protein n=1 Tax=Teratosphaeria nubilosa TaxID=161662 RepID=A0A6G1L002_9PEZI|nr:hypothetical protein EJ03DRAFT_195084 [Teratosphaeria nubilosa]
MDAFCAKLHLAVTLSLNHISRVRVDQVWRDTRWRVLVSGRVLTLLPFLAHLLCLFHALCTPTQDRVNACETWLERSRRALCRRHSQIAPRQSQAKRRIRRYRGQMMGKMECVEIRRGACRPGRHKVGWWHWTPGTCREQLACDTASWSSKGVVVDMVCACADRS